MALFRRRRQTYHVNGKLASMLYRAVVLVTTLVAVTTYAAGASLESALLRSITVLLACVVVAFLVNLGLYFEVLKQPHSNLVVDAGGAEIRLHEIEVTSRPVGAQGSQEQS